MTQHLVLGLVCVLALSASALAEAMLTHVDVFRSGAEGYHTFRIPVIETAPDGSLLAFAEGRKYNSSDPGFHDNDVDLVLKRSADNGRTWSPLKVIEDPGERWSAANPATVVDRDTGRVWVLYWRSKPGRSSRTSRPGADDQQTLARYSDDNGVTWSEPVDITKAARDFDDPKWRCSVVGPGGAIQDSKGRLMAPMWKSAPVTTFALFSEDHGQTWRRGEFAPGLNGNENELVELADGRILMDARQTGGKTRWLTRSADGGRTWSKPQPGAEVTPCACAIERYTLKSRGDDRDRIIWTGPKGPGRKTLVVRVSYDEGRTFTNERVISREQAAYSDLTILKDKTAGVLWERAGYKFITFSRFNIEFLESEGKEGAPEKL